jgi:Tfp pilus assembly protein PilO
MTAITARSYKMLTWLLPVLVALSAYSWLEKEIGAIASHIEGIKTISAKIRKTGIHIRELPEMKSDYEGLVRKKAAIASSLFGAQSEASLYELLMLKARDADVSIVAMTPRPRRPGSGFSELPLSLDVAGAFDNIGQFTGMIENVNRLMRVDELSMSKDHDGRLVAAIKLLVYVYSDTGVPPAVVKSKLEAAYQKRENYLAELQKALQVQITPSSDAYAPPGKSDPFGSVPDRAKPAGQNTLSPAAAKQNPGISLKGILWKEPPLAILETIDGRTFIVKAGENVNGSVVSSIERTEVTISSPQGKYVLHQYSDK